VTNTFFLCLNIHKFEALVRHFLELMETYFGITYCFDKNYIHSYIDQLVFSNQKGYICVADGVSLSTSYKNKEFSKVISDSSLTICDSGWVPLYLRLLYGIRREQYSGSDFLENIVNQKKYNLMFIGASEDILSALQNNLSKVDERIASMPFIPLPYKSVSDFDYEQIAEQIMAFNPDIIFVSLGMPKQELFMHNLLPYLKRGVLVGVGAAFKFHSGLATQKRAPAWMIKAKMEWMHRIFSEPNKQLKRCSLILGTMPFIFWKELKVRKHSK